MSDPLVISCPTCQKKLVWSDEYPERPFCSQQCKLIDLGAWANDEYKIPSTSPLSEEDIDSLEYKSDNDDS